MVLETFPKPSFHKDFSGKEVLLLGAHMSLLLACVVSFAPKMHLGFVLILAEITSGPPVDIFKKHTYPFKTPDLSTGALSSNVYIFIIYFNLGSNDA